MTSTTTPGRTRTGLAPDAALAAVEGLMRRLTAGEGGLLGRIGLEHLDGGGKRIRARLCLAAAEALGVERSEAVPWAAAVELLHNASLIHDDLQDGDRYRRGRPTTWSRWGGVQAVNAGDLLLLLPFVALEELVVPAETRAALSVALAKAGSEMARGQAAEPGLLDLCMAGEDPWPAYEACVRGKTGALFGVPVVGAARLAGLDGDAALTLAEPFTALGVLFQLQDDVLDLFGDKGRERRGNDLREGKVSALVAEHLGRTRDDELLALLCAPRDEPDEELIERVANRFRDEGALSRVLARVERLATEARRAPALSLAPALAALVDELAAAVLTPIAALFHSNETVEVTCAAEGGGL